MDCFFRQLEPEFEIANDPIGTLLLGENLLRRSVGGVHVGGCLSGLWLPPHVERRKLSRTTTNTRCGWKCPIQYTGIMPPTCNTSDSARNERNERTNNWCGWDCASWIFFNSILASSHVRKEIMRRDGVDESTWVMLSNGRRYHIRKQ